MSPGSAEAPDRLVLASVSPRRAEILRRLGMDPEVHPAHVDETVHPGESPEKHAERLARAKAAAVAALHPGRWVLAGDTVVVVDEEILGKPRDEEDAVAMLLRLQGRDHRVVSSLALVRPGERGGGEDPAGAAAAPEGRPGGWSTSGERRFEVEGVGGGGRVLSGVRTTRVRFRPFDRAFAEAYAATGEPMDKAGAYGIQGRGAALVEEVDGDYSGVVGLPVSLLMELLERAGRPYRFR